MEILEYGNKDNKKIILIHGFQSPYQIWDEYIKYYENDYHIIVPILPGHNPNNKEEFISLKECAKELEEYFISNYGNDVYAIYGMSMGGVLTATIWENKRLNIEKVIFDGSPLVSFNNIIKKFMIIFYIDITHKSKERDKKTLEQAVNNIITKDKLEELLQVLDNMSDTTIINYINNIGNFKLSNNIDVENTKIYYYYGTKINEMLAKKTAKYILKNYPNANIKRFNGKGHCENSLMNPNEMIKELDKVL